MTKKMEIELGPVQKTLFLPLWGRAVESQKEQPLLVDETAVKIIEQVDFDFAQLTQNLTAISQIGWIKRSLYGDQVVNTFLQHYPTGTIVNLGCGLDTTYERTDNGQLRWYDLDLPDVIALRSKFVQENERRKFLATSFLEPEWLCDIEVQGQVLFLAAGVFYYFAAETIQEFVLRLADTYPKSELLFDVSSPLGVKMANKTVLASAGAEPPSRLVWGLEKKTDILAWDPRIRLIATYYYYQTQVDGWLNRLVGKFSDFLGLQYMLHLGLGRDE